MIEIDDNIFNDLLQINKTIRGKYVMHIDTGEEDCEGGYGWRQFMAVRIIKVTQRCEKCGLIAGENPPDYFFHRHSWRPYEKCVFSWFGSTADKPLLESFKEAKL